MTDAYLIGQNIAAIAKEKNITNSELAKALECSEESIEMLIKGRMYLSWRHFEQLAEVLGTTTGHLLKRNPVSEGKRFVIDMIHQYMDIYDSVNWWERTEQ